jgi:hypothetical protein
LALRAKRELITRSDEYKVEMEKGVVDLAAG